jgi:hypothetical protein
MSIVSAIGARLEMMRNRGDSGEEDTLKGKIEGFARSTASNARVIGKSSCVMLRAMVSR